MRTVTAAALLALAGCAWPVHVVGFRGPRGHDYAEITCGQYLGDCYAEAAQFCQADYLVTDEETGHEFTLPGPKDDGLPVATTPLKLPASIMVRCVAHQAPAAAPGAPPEPAPEPTSKRVVRPGEKECQYDTDCPTGWDCQQATVVGPKICRPK